MVQIKLVYSFQLSATFWIIFVWWKLDPHSLICAFFLHIQCEVYGEYWHVDNPFIGPSAMTFGETNTGKSQNVSLNLLCIAGYTHMQCLTWHAFPHLSEHRTSFQARYRYIFCCARCGCREDAGAGGECGCGRQLGLRHRPPPGLPGLPELRTLSHLQSCPGRNTALKTW